jgi:hypothetical protein
MYCIYLPRVLIINDFYTLFGLWRYCKLRTWQNNHPTIGIKIRSPHYIFSHVNVFLCIQDIDGNGQEKIMKAINVIYNDIKLGI